MLKFNTWLLKYIETVLRYYNMVHHIAVNECGANVARWLSLSSAMALKPSFWSALSHAAALRCSPAAQKGAVNRIDIIPSMVRDAASLRSAEEGRPIIPINPRWWWEERCSTRKGERSKARLNKKEATRNGKSANMTLPFGLEKEAKQQELIS